MSQKSMRRRLAERLRREEGLSYSEITARTGISQSTLSGWLRHVPLTPAQQARLDAKLQAHRAGFGARVWPIHQRRFDQAREQAVQAGAEAAQSLPDTPSVDELALAMLYLGEGGKKRGSVQLANMNPQVLRFFLWALRRLYQIDEARLAFRLNLAAAARPSESACLEWWCQQLGCRPEQFTATQFDRRSKSAEFSTGYHGVCTVSYHDTRLHAYILGLAEAYLAHCAQRAK